MDRSSFSILKQQLKFATQEEALENNLSSNRFLSSDSLHLEPQFQPKRQKKSKTKAQKSEDRGAYSYRSPHMSKICSSPAA